MTVICAEHPCLSAVKNTNTMQNGNCYFHPNDCADTDTRSQHMQSLSFATQYMHMACTTCCNLAVRLFESWSASCCELMNTINTRPVRNTAGWKHCGSMYADSRKNVSMRELHPPRLCEPEHDCITNETRQHFRLHSLTKICNYPETTQEDGRARVHCLVYPAAADRRQLA